MKNETPTVRRMLGLRLGAIKPWQFATIKSDDLHAIPATKADGRTRIMASGEVKQLLSLVGYIGAELNGLRDIIDCATETGADMQEVRTLTALANERDAQCDALRMLLIAQVRFELRDSIPPVNKPAIAILDDWSLGWTMEDPLLAEPECAFAELYAEVQIPPAGAPEMIGEQESE